MLSGGAAGLVSVETLRKEQEEIRRKEKQNKPLEGQLLFICTDICLPALGHFCTFRQFNIFLVVV